MCWWSSTAIPSAAASTFCAARPAPVQVSWLGYAGTTGAPFIDVADRRPHRGAQSGRLSREKLEYLPDSFFVSDDTGRAIGHGAAPAPKPACRQDGFRLLLLQPCDEIQRRQLRALDADPGAGARQHPVAARSRRRSAAANLRKRRAPATASRRSGWSLPAMPIQETHLARHALADLFLDTLPYNAHATACDALWAGLPVLTCARAPFRGPRGGQPAARRRLAGTGDGNSGRL